MSKQWCPPINAARQTLGDDTFQQLDIATKVMRTRTLPCDSDVDPLTVPIYQTSVYRNRNVQHYLDILNESGYIYQRLSNPTLEAVQVVINELENGAGSMVYKSGLCAVNAVFLTFLKAGDHLICQKPCYSGTSTFIETILMKFGVQVDWIPQNIDVAEYERFIKPNTKMIYVETPSNPTMSLTDLEELGRLRGKHPELLTVVDGTFASPCVQQPLNYGVDISIHSCSKYMGGHTDLIAGSVTVKDVQLWKQLNVQNACTGGTLAPFDAFLLHRGLKTLLLRMEKHSQNAMQIAQFLEQHSKVAKVWYPGLVSHPQHNIAIKQMRLFGGMIAFEMRSLDEARRLVEALKVINLAVSLGGTESLVEHPASMSHGPMLIDREHRQSAMISDGLIRFSVGLEDVGDLIEDLRQALQTV